MIGNECFSFSHLCRMRYASTSRIATPATRNARILPPPLARGTQYPVKGVASIASWDAVRLHRGQPDHSFMLMPTSSSRESVSQNILHCLGRILTSSSRHNCLLVGPDGIHAVYLSDSWHWFTNDHLIGGALRIGRPLSAALSAVVAGRRIFSRKRSCTLSDDMNSTCSLRSAAYRLSDSPES